MTKLPTLPGFDAQAFHKYLKNTGWLMMARTGSLFLKMLVTVWALPNYLGDGGYGAYNYPIVLTFFFVAAAALGTDGVVTRQLLQYPGQQHRLLGTAFRVRLLAGLAVLPLIYLTYYAIRETAAQPPAAPFSYVAIVSLVCVVQAANIIDSFFQARAEGKHIMQVQVGANVLSTILKLALIFSKAPLEWFIGTLLLDAVFIAVGYLVIYRARGHRISTWQYDPGTARNLLHQSWPLAFSAVMISLYMKTDQLMLDAYLGKEVLGVYSNVVQLSEGWYFIPQALVSALFPAMMHARRDDPVRYKKRLQDLYDLMVVISVSIALLITVAAPYLYRYLYKPEFAAAAPVLTIYIWSGIFVFLGGASSQYLIAEGYTRLSLIRTAVGAVINIGLNILWIPRYGMIGAAWATLIAYGSSTFLLILIPRTREQGTAMLRSLLFISVLSKIFRKRASS